LNVTQDSDKIGAIEQKYFSSKTCEDQSNTISSYSPSLGVDNFGGLFVIAGIYYVVSSWFMSLSSFTRIGMFWSKLVKMVKHFD